MTSPLLRILPYLGTLPFVLGTIAKLTDTVPMLYFMDMRRIVLSYGLLILSFMAGVHWGQYLAGVRGKVNLLISSNIVALVAWFASLILLPAQICLVLIALFAIVYLIDRGLAFDPTYMQTRRNVTLIVCVSLGLLVFA